MESSFDISPGTPPSDFNAIKGNADAITNLGSSGSESDRKSKKFKSTKAAARIYKDAKNRLFLSELGKKFKDIKWR